MKKIFVGNLSFNATEDAVRSMFAEYGTVSSVILVTDRDTGQARGFGQLDGRALNVNEARPKSDRGSGGGGFGGQRRRY